MKLFVLLLATCAIALPAVAGWEVKMPYPVPRFACYYGSANVAALAEYPLVIMESENYTPAQIAEMKAKGACVVGYLTTGESDDPLKPVSASNRPIGLNPYYLDRDGNGVPDRNASWNSYYADARAPEWRARILDTMIPLIVNERGCDGVFLDTLDTVDLYPETRAGMEELLTLMRQRYPRITIIANRGFTMTDRLVREVDGIMFEDFSTVYDPGTNRSRKCTTAELAWNDGLLAKVRTRGGPFGPPVLMLDYADRIDPSVKDFAVSRARNAGVTYCISNGRLTQLPIESGTGAK